MPAYRVIERGAVDLLGEGVCWVARRNAVFWVDIKGQALHSYELTSGQLLRWPIPHRIGWIVERAQRDDFVIGLKCGFATLALEPFAITLIGNPEPDRPHNRLNDAKVDHAGRIWAGSMDDRELEATGALYRIDPGFHWSRHDDHYRVTNGPTFSVDGKTLYHTESVSRTVYAFDLHDDGSLHSKRTLLTFAADWGYPDGMTTDSEGGLWVAHFGGGRISRFMPDGAMHRSILLPASQITNCAFAGDKLERLFVTSAATGTKNEPLAGALFEVDVGFRGIAPVPFSG